MIWYVSGTRADYGLMRAVLQAIDRHPDLRLGILVTGMHLEPAYGKTVDEIAADGFDIVAKFPSGEGTSGGAEMARGISRMISGFTDAMERGRPDIVLLLGDRGEMLAGAIAAIHLDLPIVHIHGGERSGTVDEPIRHAISKLAHYHFAATEESAERLRRMGEHADAVLTVGAPGLVGLGDAVMRSKNELAAEVGFDPSRPIALFAYHAVLQEAYMAGTIAGAILESLVARGFQTIALKPNSDSGGDRIRTELDARTGQPGLVVKTHLTRSLFINWMAVVDLMIGNSSSGIIEAATFGTPVINVGPRQNLRQRNGNVIDAASTPEAIDAAIATVASGTRFPTANIYGDGASDERIAALLATLPLQGVTWKSNAY
ncbi:UDP-N-acetylglucosamine 2-epimerase (hydrolyzing) [Roseomonas aeriglobus]|nr:UDP-N-acetylglucosamine 2-epimerase (hydrolyzing) [Roseomonas aeriglobus]MBN2974462.1 UDP-N-acetylglucosamine 2-epimerase (hydrolyzing) [Roseomonas aeriglobus]